MPYAYTLRPTPYALRLTPYALRPTPTPYALRPTPYALRLRPTPTPTPTRCCVYVGSQARKLLILMQLWNGDGDAPATFAPQIFPASWLNWERLPLHASGWAADEHPADAGCTCMTLSAEQVQCVDQVCTTTTATTTKYYYYSHAPARVSQVFRALPPKTPGMTTLSAAVTVAGGNDVPGARKAKKTVVDVTEQDDIDSVAERGARWS